MLLQMLLDFPTLNREKTDLMNREQVNHFIENRFAVPGDEGPDKVMEIADSVRKYIKPNMSLYFGFFHSRAYALAYEIARQFWGQKPNFDLIAAGILEFGVILLQGGLVKKMIAAFGGNTYPYPSPNKVIQRALQNREVTIENWTNLTIPLRLMCGALNLPFMATNSLSGSGIVDGNEQGYRKIHNPFEPETEAGIVSPLNPDIAIVHGFAADRCGNTIVLGPHGDDIWGLMACKKGVLVTVEHLVSTDFIRQYSYLVKIPGHLVNAVSVVPFGAHPQPMTNLGLEQFQGYGEDYRFRLDCKAATKTPEKMMSWITEWVLNCRNHEEYLKKLGRDRIFFLKGKSAREAWKYDLIDKIDQLSMEPEFNSNEAMIICAARGIKQAVAEKGHKVVLAGAGMANLASWIAVYDLKHQGYDVELLAESGFYGYLPRPMDPYIFNYSNIFTNKMQAGFIEILGILAGGNNNRCLAVIGAGQIDKFGNVNSTQSSNGSFIVGSGGANDLGSSAAEVILLCQQGVEKFVDKLNYITTPGTKVRSVYSGMGIYKKENERSELVLAGLVPGDMSKGMDERISDLKNACGWDIVIADQLETIDPPSMEELISLRSFDPERYLIG